MRFDYSKQYLKPCVVAEAGDTAQTIIDACRDACAIFREDGEECFIVSIRTVGPELYTEDALRGSLPFLEDGDAPGTAEKISQHSEEKNR